MPYYEKPLKALMREFAASLAPDQVFSRADAVAWFAKTYPLFKRASVEMHVQSMSVNAVNFRRGHPEVRAGSNHDLFYVVGPGQYRLWREGVDPAPYYAASATGSADPAGGLPHDPDEESEQSLGALGGNEFGAEKDLQNYLKKNMGSLEQGLQLYRDEDLLGYEYPAGGQRRIDLLGIGADGAFVVVELKVSRGYDRVVGQILRYMAWIRANLAGDKPVRGIIVAGNISDDLKLAASTLADVKLVEYELQFKLRQV